MAEVTKYQLVPNNNNNNNNIVSDIRSHFSLFRTTRKSSVFVYGVIFVFIAFSIFLAFSPPSSTSSPSSWFINIFTLNSTSPTINSSFRSPDFPPNLPQFHENNDDNINPRSQTQAPISENQLPPDKVDDFNEKNTNFNDYINSNYTSEKITPQISPISGNKDGIFESNDTDSKTPEKISPKFSPISSPTTTKVDKFNPNNVTNNSEKQSNQTTVVQPQISPQISPKLPEKKINQTSVVQPQIPRNSTEISSINVNNTVAGETEQKQENELVKQGNQTEKKQGNEAVKQGNETEKKQGNETDKKQGNESEEQGNQTEKKQGSETEKKQGNEVEKLGNQTEKKQGNETEKKQGNEVEKQGNEAGEKQGNQKKKKNMIDSLVDCDFYDGEWIRDESYPLYEPGSCKLVDEQFNCILNGRPDTDYQKLKWKPKGCSLPRLEGKKMLKLLRGKRLVFVGDSLNRNMWESLVCILKSAVKNPKNVYEAYGRHYFRTEASYSFVFKDYNFTIEFFVAPFLVQQWEVKENDGSTKETLRLDLVVRDSDHFKYADVVIFNTGHWWTHEKTSKGEDYYQEGSHVYQQLDVQEAFRKAITTWGRWIDANINPQKTHVFFRGYSSTHFRGGQWNSGGQCDSETEPIRNETYLTKYPWKMKVLENVIKNMKTPVSYLNITKLTDYRKDAHPSVYRKQRLSAEEKITPLKFQDCSHWCLPGVPDSWNELIYAEILRKHFLDKQKK